LWLKSILIQPIIFYLSLMKKILFIGFALLLAHSSALPSELTDFLKHQPNVKSVEPVQANSFFVEALIVFIIQPLDHSNPSAGTFLQRVFISAKAKTSPVVLVTEGYAADYARSQRYLNELCPLFNAGQVVVEHRYFGKSWPDSLRWEFLTVENAAGDHHAVVQLLKPYFTGQWINTGISKGGQTALLHRVFFPDDVDLTVSYVAPVNFGVEDGRHEPYIARVSGTKADRLKIKEFQKEVLRRRDHLMPLFEKLVQDKKYTFKVSLPEVYDFTVLEFSFSFWQWGNNPAEIPTSSATDEVVFNYWMKISSPDYFSKEGLEKNGSFFVQAAKELGYYGYDTRPFRKLLAIPTAKGYLTRLFLPEGFTTKFDPSSAVRTQKFLNTTTLPLIFIYGKNDPWNASGAVVPKKSDILKIVQIGGSHRTRISTLDEGNKRLVMEKIKKTIGITIPEKVH
jgi:hypothetical protein